jgi:sulfatase maturation enzyme AslB (radical SAM superfamily)
MNIEVTTRCNMKCAHCARSCTEKGEDMSPHTFTAAMEFCKQLRDLCGCNRDSISPASIRIVLSGGEPTIHPKFWDFVKIALDTIGMPVDVGVSTNGKRTEDALRLAKMAEEKQIAAGLSLDSFHEKISPKVVDAFRRRPKGYKIVHTKDNIAPVGRALKNGLGKENKHVPCACAGLVIDTQGLIYACDCRDLCFGNVYQWKIPRAYLWALDKYGIYCGKLFLNESKAAADKDPAKALRLLETVQAVLCG